MKYKKIIITKFFFLKKEMTSQLLNKYIVKYIYKIW